MRAPPQLLEGAFRSRSKEEARRRHRVHLPGVRLSPEEISFASNPMSNPLLDDQSTPRSLNVSTPRERNSGRHDELVDDVGDSISQQGTPRSVYARESARSGRSTPRSSYLGDYDPNGSDSNLSRSRTPSPERHATFASEQSNTHDPPHHNHEAMTDGGFNLYGNLYGDQSESSEDDDQRTAGDDDDHSTEIGRSVSQANASYELPSSAKKDSDDEEGDGFNTHRYGMSQGATKVIL